MLLFEYINIKTRFANRRWLVKSDNKEHIKSVISNCLYNLRANNNHPDYAKIELHISLVDMSVDHYPIESLATYYTDDTGQTCLLYTLKLVGREPQMILPSPDNVDIV